MSSRRWRSRRKSMRGSEAMRTETGADVFRATEAQPAGWRGFLRACRAAGQLQYRNLRYYPSNLVLAGAQELTAVGVWYFVGRFLNSSASQSVKQYGANYLAYVV